MYYKPKLNFKRMSVEALDQAVENVHTKMNGNALFADAADEVAELGTALAAYRTAVADAIRGGKHATTVRDQVRADVEVRMQLLASLVNRVAKGDPAIILSAGFDHNKAREPKGNCPRPVDFVAVVGQLGSRRVTLKVKPHPTARSYRFAYRAAGSSDAWIEVSSHGCTRALEGLQQFMEYEFRCTYIGTNPDLLNYSDPVTATVI